MLTVILFNTYDAKNGWGHISATWLYKSIVGYERTEQSNLERNALTFKSCFASRSTVRRLHITPRRAASLKWPSTPTRDTFSISHTMFPFPSPCQLAASYATVFMQEIRVYSQNYNSRILIIRKLKKFGYLRIVANNNRFFMVFLISA